MQFLIVVKLYPETFNPYPMPDGRVDMVEMWIDSVPNVANGYGVFYDTGI